jgi:hypothetical protein
VVIPLFETPINDLAESMFVMFVEIESFRVFNVPVAVSKSLFPMAVIAESRLEFAETRELLKVSNPNESKFVLSVKSKVDSCSKK